MATATISLTVPSPADKAELILKHFPALKPRFNEDRGCWECPSMSDPHVLHTITSHRHEHGPVVRRCDCKSTRLCTHLILVERMTGGDLVDREKLYISYDVERFNSRYASVFEPEPAMRPRRAS